MESNTGRGAAVATELRAATRWSTGMTRREVGGRGACWAGDGCAQLGW